MRMRKAQIHRTSIVQSDHVGHIVQIGAFTRIYSTAEIGPSCRIGNHCVIGHDVRIGRHVIIKDGVLISNGVTIEDRVTVGRDVTFADSLGTPSAPVERTRVREGARIGGNSTVQCGVTVGRYAEIAPGSVVTRDVPDFALVCAAPARHEGWVCSCGQVLELAVKGKGEGICSCGRRYTLVQGEVTGVAPLPV